MTGTDGLGAAGDADRGEHLSSLSTTVREWGVAYHTIRNMRPVQLAGIAERRLRHATVPRLPFDFDERYDRRVPAELSPTPGPVRRNLDALARSLSPSERDQYRDTVSAAADGRFTFLNRTLDLGDPIDWERDAIDSHPIFWRLKLEAFEQFERVALVADSPSAVEGVRSAFERQLSSWVDENPIGEDRYLRRSWIPHSVSLRVLNWSRYAAWCSGDPDVTVPEELHRAIYKNALFLENHVEHEIGGNHLIENAAALLTAGVLFSDHDTGWERIGLELLRRAARTQFLPDGAHFERSPMYHVTVLRRYATAYDLLSQADLPTTIVGGTAEYAMGWLSRLVEPSGSIPLLNDAVNGEALEAETCLAYCRACGIEPRFRSMRHPDGAGYRPLSTDAGTLLFDVGTVGPPHLPAHSHNDQLSVLLWMDGTPVLADTGVYDYGANERRRYCRSVAAHNTAQYDDVEPIPLGGSYMMGKRTSVSVTADAPGRIEARHARRSFTGPSYEHRRTVTTVGSGWRVRDSVDGDADATYTVRYHFHPEVDVVSFEGTDAGVVVLTDDRRIARVEFSEGAEMRATETPYFEEYGRQRDRSAVELTASTGSDVTARFRPAASTD